MTKEEIKAKALAHLEEARKAAAQAVVQGYKIGNPAVFGDKTVWAMQDVTEELTKTLGRIEQIIQDFKQAGE